MTSGGATVSYIKNQKENANIYLVGTPSLEEEFINNGFNIVKCKNENPDYVVVGYDTTMTYDKISNACTHIQNGVPYIGTHPDMKFSLGDNMFNPDAGAIQEMINVATDKTPEIIGKPSPHIVEEIIRKLGLFREDVAIVGDRLYTDIQLGINAGITSILVLTGETNRESYKNSSIKADYVFDSVKELEDIIK
jgi:HAD superfamily hydrolase (TIGR01450 family)